VFREEAVNSADGTCKQKLSCVNNDLRMTNLLGAIIEFPHKRFSTHGEEIG